MRKVMPASVVPASLYVTFLLVLPVVFLAAISMRSADGGLTLANYRHVFTGRLYVEALLGTLRMAIGVTLLTLLAGYPIALFIVRSGSRLVPLVLLATLLPLFVSVVVRSFGWMVLLGRQGPVNQLLIEVGLSTGPVRILNTALAVSIGLVHILLPLMILPIAAVLRGIDRQWDEAALTLGASRRLVFTRIILPLSLPGVAAGCLLVMAHVIAAFVLPELLGSDSIRLMATMIFQQVMVVGDIGFGAALALVMVAMTFLLLAAARLASHRAGA
jgi:putative spermidine/putrescine transport system permease protein